MPVVVNEIFHSIQGESSFMGLPCVFVRLTGCNLRCVWCDTEYAFEEGRPMELDEVLAAVEAYDCPLVEITGGEPLAQEGVHPLMTALCDRGRTVLLETGGSIDISGVDRRVRRIVDLKCPGSGMEKRNHWPNLEALRATDEVKFVVADRADFEWAAEVIRRHNLAARCAVFLSPVFGVQSPDALAGWILEERLPVRFQLQMHKFIWDPVRRGV